MCWNINIYCFIFDKYFLNMLHWAMKLLILNFTVYVCARIYKNTRHVECTRVSNGEGEGKEEDFNSRWSELRHEVILTSRRVARVQGKRRTAVLKNAPKRKKPSKPVTKAKSKKPAAKPSVEELLQKVSMACQLFSVIIKLTH